MSALIVPPAAARPRGAIVVIPRTTLDVALTSLAEQTGADIVSTEPDLARIAVRPVRGWLSVREALDRLLAGTPLVAQAIDARGFRIVRRPRPAIAPRPAPRAPSAPPVAPPPPDIVVTAAKRGVPLLRYPGSVATITLDDHAADRQRPGLSLDDVAGVTPILQHTELGAGRNKLFIRGIADSSFNGPTQATASVYFGDVQLGYSGPDPALRLYDVSTVEILEGPQGTLYGAGAIGGIIRITPNPVDLSLDGGSASAAMTLTQGGDAGYDVEAAVNLVLAQDRAGVRAVAYRVRDGGYIDDVGRGLNDVNGSVTEGGRLALAFRPGGDWSIDLGGLFQRIDAADAQYADSDSGALTRRSVIAQPFGNRIALGRIVIGRTWLSGLRLISSSGIVGFRSRNVFDATRNRPGANPLVYTERNDDLLAAHETRLSRTLPDGSSWLVGATTLFAQTEQARTLGPVDHPGTIVGVTNRTTAASAFAEATLPLSRTFSVTAGGRLTRTRTDGDPSEEARDAQFVRGRTTVRIDPTIAVSSRIAPDVAVYARYQSGFRTGGLAVARGIGRVADFRPDAIHMIETGFRLQPADPRMPALSAGLSYARWRDIQADLVDRRGLPYTANTDNARIVSIETSGRWSPLAGIDASLALLYTVNEVTGAMAASSRRQNRRLPETPAFSGSASLGYRWTIGERDRFSVSADGHYTGRSVLGTGDYFDIDQGHYALANLAAVWMRGPVSTSLTLENVGNGTGNRFALGNPFLLATRGQSTPVPPRRLRIGASIRW